MVDVGETHGALVVYVPAWLTGQEIEIRSAGTPWSGVHTAVRRRELRNAGSFAGVFGSLPGGRYQLRVAVGRPEGLIADQITETTVTPGRITEVHWLPDVSVVRRRMVGGPSARSDLSSSRCTGSGEVGHLPLQQS
jgi:hypothetical protein